MQELLQRSVVVVACYQQAFTSVNILFAGVTLIWAATVATAVYLGWLRQHRFESPFFPATSWHYI